MGDDPALFLLQGPCVVTLALQEFGQRGKGAERKLPTLSVLRGAGSEPHDARVEIHLRPLHPDDFAFPPPGQGSERHQRPHVVVQGPERRALPPR